MDRDRRRALLECAWVYALAVLAAGISAFLDQNPRTREWSGAIVGASFLVLALRASRRGASTPEDFGLALGGFLGSEDGKLAPGWPKLAAKELGVALAIVAVTLPPFTVGWWLWNRPTHSFAFTAPPDLASFVIAQFLVVALPEEALFRGFFLTRVADGSGERDALRAHRVTPRAILVSSLLFALVHVITDVRVERLAVFFPALLFGAIRCKRGGIGAALVVHAIYNVYADVIARSWL